MNKLPDGEHLIEGKIYVVKGGEIIEIKDAQRRGCNGGYCCRRRSNYGN